MCSTRILLAATLAAALAPRLPGQCPSWTQLYPSDPGLYDYFGTALAVGDGLAVVGAFLDDDLGLNAGSAYVFDTATGQQLWKLLASDGVANDRFGNSVAIDGTTVIVGAAQDGNGGEGKAYLFDAQTGQELAILTASDGLPLDWFGYAVAIDGDLAVVGAPFAGPNARGVVYLYDVPTGVERILLAPDGSSGDTFGFGVGVVGTTVAVSAPGDNNETGANSGTVWIFDLAAGTQHRIPAPAAVAGDRFGTSLALSGSTLLAGVPFSDEFGTFSGSVYVYDALTGEELARLLASDPQGGALFGYAIAIDGDRALIGARADDTVADVSGAAYLFDARAGRELAKLIPPEGAEADTFGYAVGIHGSTVLVGVPSDDGTQSGTGSAALLDANDFAGRPYCFGAGALAPCPCGNEGALIHGCANGDFTVGARLCGSGATAVSADELVLAVAFSTPNQPGVFLQGDQTVAGELGLPFGDGLRCAEGNERLLEFAMPDASGATATTIPLAARGAVLAGDVKRYQWWYRDPLASPCGEGFNLSNGLEVIWGP